MSYLPRDPCDCGRLSETHYWTPLQCPDPEPPAPAPDDVEGKG